MKIRIHKCNGGTTSDLLQVLNDVKAKNVSILSLNEKFISVSMKGLSKKEITSFEDAGFKIVLSGKDINNNDVSQLVYNGKSKRPTE